MIKKVLLYDIIRKGLGNSIAHIYFFEITFNIVALVLKVTLASYYLLVKKIRTINALQFNTTKAIAIQRSIK